MADASIDLQATNLFGLSANFNTQSSTTTVGTQNVATNDESGNVACQQNITEQTDYTQTATYCGTDFITDIGTFLTEFGNVQNSLGVITQLTINMTAGDYATIEITGHNHEINPHVAGLDIGYADVSDFLPHWEGVSPPTTGESFYQWDGFGVPDFGVDTGANSSPSSATVTFSMNHVDTEDEGGDHLVGKNITPRCELTLDFEGIPTSNTASEIELDMRGNSEDMLMVYVDSTDTNDSNSEFDTFSCAAHANTDLATV